MTAAGEQGTASLPYSRGRSNNKWLEPKWLRIYIYIYICTHTYIFYIFAHTYTASSFPSRVIPKSLSSHAPPGGVRNHSMCMVVWSGRRYVLHNWIFRSCSSIENPMSPRHHTHAGTDARHHDTKINKVQFYCLGIGSNFRKPSGENKRSGKRTDAPAQHIQSTNLSMGGHQLGQSQARVASLGSQS